MFTGIVILTARLVVGTAGRSSYVTASMACPDDFDERPALAHFGAVNISLNARLALAFGVILMTSGPVQSEPPGNCEKVPKKLIAEFSASSTADGYQAARIRDGRASTAWRSKPGEANGATVTLTYSSARHLAWVTLFPGDGASKESHAAIARPTQVTVLWEGGEQTFALEDVRKQQDLVIKGLARTKTLTVRVDATSGPADSGVAISEVAGYEPYEVITVKKRLRMKMTDNVQALRVQDTPNAVKQVVDLGERVVPWLVAELVRGERLSGVRALEALQGIDRKRAWRVVFRTLGKGEPASAVIAAEFAAKGGARDLADAVYGAYERLSGESQLSVLGSLAQLGDPRALKLLSAGVRSGEAALVALAGEHLAGYGDDAVFEMVALAGDPDEAVRRRAVEVLIAWGGPTVLQILCDLANGPDSAAGVDVIAILARSKAMVARASLIYLASQPPSQIRDAALSALVSGGGTSVVELITHASQADAATAARVADALGRSSSEAVRAALVQSILTAEAGPANQDVVRALTGHGKAGVKAVLAAVVASPEQAPRAKKFLTQAYATSAVILTTALPGLPSTERLDPVRIVALEVIAHAQYVPAAVQVAAVFRAPGASLRVRLAALQTAAQLPADASREVAREGLADPDPQLSQAGLAAAIRLGDGDAGKLLLTGMQSMEVSEWPAASIEALASLKTKAAIAVFRKAMSKAPKDLQMTMLYAAKRIGGKDATRFLVETSMSGGEISRTASQLLRSR